MSQLEKLVKIICPKCKASKKIPIPKDIIKKKETGATSVYVPAHMVCEHEFYAYIDKNFMVRDYLLLEYTIQEEDKRAEKLKTDILKKSEDYDLSVVNVLNFISPRDLRSILYGCFIESPIIFIENKPGEERFGVLLNFIAKLFPDAAKSLTLMSPDFYLKYSEENATLLQKIIVYNVIYKLSVQKPFGDSDSEPFEEIIKLLTSGSSQIQMIYAKNFIDYLLKFHEELKTLKDEKNDKIIKILKKKYPKQENILTSDMINILRTKIEFKETYTETGEITKEKVLAKVEEDLKGAMFIYNEKISIRQAENLPNLTEKNTLRTLRKNKCMSIDGIIDELEIMEHEMVIEIEFSRVPEILDGFVLKGFIEKI